MVGKERSFEDWLKSGDVRSALVLKGAFTEREISLVRQVWKAGLEQGRSEAEAELAVAKAQAERLRATLEKSFRATPPE
jgi:hypothetical protein